MARWKAFQSRSYFAVQLPHHWWIWAIDIQLDAPIDAEQLAYFRRAARELDRHPANRIILATARPSWCDDPGKDDRSVLTNHQNLCWFIDRMLDDDAWRTRLRLVLTGDKHHYARYQPTPEPGSVPVSPDNDGGAPELVTCGGGGAYLSSTHHLPRDITPFWHERGEVFMSEQPYVRRLTFPSARISASRLRWGALLTPLRNPGLVPFIGLIYGALLTTLAASLPVSEDPFYARLADPQAYPRDMPSLARWVELLPALAAALLLFGLLLAFAQHGAGGRGGRAKLAAVLHWGLHLAVLAATARITGDAASALNSRAVGLTDTEVLVRALLGAAGLLGVAGLAGGVVVGVYLLVCDFARLHENESFAAPRYEGYKSHLRIHVTESGLHVRAVGIPRVPRDWGVFGGALRPFDGQLARAEEVDAFVVRRGPVSG